MKPLINLDELELTAEDPRGPFAERYGVISDRIGARKLGYNLTIVPPGKRACPFHNHRQVEEMFLILDGAGLLRFGDEQYPLRPGDVIACPPGDRAVAHQIINTGTVDLRYLAVGTREHTDVCEYPDSDKVAVIVGAPGRRELHLVLRAGDTVDYFDGELPAGGAAGGSAPPGEPSGGPSERSTKG